MFLLEFTLDLFDALYSVVPSFAPHRSALVEYEDYQTLLLKYLNQVLDVTNSEQDLVFLWQWIPILIDVDEPLEVLLTQQFPNLFQVVLS